MLALLCSKTALWIWIVWFNNGLYSISFWHHCAFRVNVSSFFFKPILHIWSTSFILRTKNLKSFIINSQFLPVEVSPKKSSFFSFDYWRRDYYCVHCFLHCYTYTWGWFLFLWSGGLLCNLLLFSSHCTIDKLTHTFIKEPFDFISFIVGMVKNLYMSCLGL